MTIDLAEPRTQPRCTFPPMHPEACQCLAEKCGGCDHKLSGHDQTGCRVSSGFLGLSDSMVACACTLAFDREAYLAERGLPASRAKGGR